MARIQATRLTDQILIRAGPKYQELLANYFSPSPQFDESGDERPIEALSANTRSLLQKAASIRTEDHGSDTVGIRACIFALLDIYDANANRNLERLGVDAASLKKELEPIPDPPASDYISQFNNDTAHGSTDDLLNIEDEVNAFSRLAASRDVSPPLSIGVFGDWGAGKSFFMERMYAEIERIKNDDAHMNSPIFYTGIVQVRFNAWHYIEANLWASLVEYIFSELDRWLRTQRTPQNDPKYKGAHVDALFEQLATSRQLKLESYRDLIATRRDLRAAEKELDDARANNEQALQKAASQPLDNPWPSVVTTFLQHIGDDQKKSLKPAVDHLGLTELSNNLTGSANESSTTPERRPYAQELPQMHWSRALAQFPAC